MLPSLGTVFVTWDIHAALARFKPEGSNAYANYPFLKAGFG